MIKELDALEIYLDKRIKDIKNYLEFNERSETEKGFTPTEELQICYLAKRMLAIENTNPSEAMKCLEDLRKQVSFANSDGCIFDDIYDDIIKDIELIKQDLLKAQEQEKENAEYKKVLKIIKEKRANINWIEKCKTLDEYNDTLNHWEFALTQKEFDTLKRYTG